MSSAVAMPCPVCSVSLVMSERQGIEIDYCPECRGVWLDRGELDKIMKRSAADFAPAGGRPAQHQRYQQQTYSADSHGFGHKERKKSFFEEIFG